MATKKERAGSAAKKQPQKAAPKQAAKPEKRKSNPKSGSKKDVKINKPKNDHYAVYIMVLFALSVILSIFVYIDMGDGGMINTFVKHMIFGLFGWTGYFVPISVIGYFAYLIFYRQPKRMWLKLAQTTGALSALSSLISLRVGFENPYDAFYDGYTNIRGGGYIGALIGGFSKSMLQSVLSYILFSVILIILLANIVNLPWKKYILEAVDFVTGKTNGSLEKARNNHVKPKKQKKQKEVYDEIPAEEYYAEEFEDRYDDGYDDKYGDDIEHYERKPKKKGILKNLSDSISDMKDKFIGGEEENEDDFYNRTISKKSSKKNPEPKPYDEFLAGLYDDEYDESQDYSESENSAAGNNYADEFIPEEFDNGIGDVFGDEEDTVPAEDVSLIDKTVNSKMYRSNDDIFGSDEFDAGSLNDEPVFNAYEDAAEVPFNEMRTEMGTKKGTETLRNESVQSGINSEINTERSAAVPAPVPAENKAKREVKDRADKITDSEKQSFSEELDTALEKEHIEYVFPPLDLLDKASGAGNDMRVEMRRTAENLISVLSDFGVKAKLLQVTQGPAVTRYEIQPDTGTKLSKITNLAEDIALNLAVSTVLVAPVPGKAAVGIEIPNNTVSPVPIREILESPAFTDAKASLTVGLGKDIGGNVVVGNIAKWPHILIAGQTGSGKSVCINTIITSILYKASPEDVKLIMIDPKVVELSGYNGIPHLLIPVVSDPKKAAGALNWAVTEMMKRYDLFKNTGVRKLEGYNKLMEQTGGEKMPQIVIIIDELADLMMVAAKEVEDYVCRLAQLARAAGIHLIIATQRPSVDVITGLIKANVPSRIAFSVASQVDSRTILDRGGAEKLLGMGDMLYYPTGARAAERVQGAYVSDDEIERIIDFIKESMGDVHYSEELENEIQKCAVSESNSAAGDGNDEGDALLGDAIELALNSGKISTSMVQRRLGVGYARAGRIIDQMEARGIISGANGSKPRDVLVSHADLNTGGDTDEEENNEE